MGIPKGPNFPWLPPRGRKQDYESPQSLKDRLVLLLTNTWGYFERPSCAEINWCRKDPISKKHLQKMWENDDWNNGNNYLQPPKLSTVFSENCLQTQQSWIQRTISTISDLFWKNTLTKNNKESYCRLAKFTPKIWIPNSKKTSKKITGKNKSSSEIHQKNGSFVCKILPESKILHLKPGPPDAQFNKDFTKSWWKKNIFGGETIKWAISAKPYEIHCADCFIRILIV